MQLLIDNKSGMPIYDQIFSQIKGQIISGKLSEEDALPSIRSLAKDLKISVITTKRAYEELEKEGYIYSVPGKGFYVAQKNTELIREHRLREIEEHLAAAMRLAAPIGISREDVKEMMDLLWEEDNE